MGNARIQEMVTKLQERLLDYGADHSRLLLKVLRRLARGRPVTREQTDAIIAELGIVRDEAHRFLKEVTERDADNHIVGIMGLSLNDHPHRLYANGASMSAWCAEDTLFLPSLLQQTATVESYSPLSKEKIRLTVSPERVEAISPANAVVSMVIVDPTQDDMASVEAIWSTFCEHIHFFASQEEAERWAAGRGDIEILTVDEGFELGRQVWSRVLSYAEQAERHLEHLFEIELQYRPKMSPVTSSEGRVGEYLGSGDGTVKGSRIQGTVRWDLFEDQGENVCPSNLRGIIETNDGAQIRFDSMGFFIRPDKSNPNRWVTSASVHFDTADRRYVWLSALLAVWEGELDMETYRHRYQAYAQVVE